MFVVFEQWKSEMLIVITMAISQFLALGDRGGRNSPPGSPNSFIFMQFSEKKDRLAYSIWKLAPPPRGNPWSATAQCHTSVIPSILLLVTLLCFNLQPPESPGEGWDLGIREWDASYYRPACPQEIWEFDDRFYEIRNQSEDCLHLNIFQPNVSYYLITY